MNSHTPTNHLTFRAARDEAARVMVQRPLNRVVKSESLFSGAHEIGIEHGDAMYRLKITRQGKLILNK